MLLIFLTLVVFIIVISCASVASFVLISGVVHLLLHVWCEGWVLRQDLFFGHLKCLEQEVCLSLSDLVVAVLGKIFTSLELEMLLILNLLFVDVVLERLLFNLHFDVLFLFRWQVLVWDFHALTLLLKIAGILEWSSSFEVGLECSLHVWKFTLHA